jgi:hypothetical protein
MADCERIHAGVPAEPINAVSSLAYVAAGVWIWRHDRVQGGALIAAGAGSVAYHGFREGAARVLHDASIFVLVVVVALSARRIWRGARAQRTLIVGSFAAFTVALPMQLFGRTGGPWCRPEGVLQAHSGWHVLTATALACAFFAARGHRGASAHTTAR